MGFIDDKQSAIDNIGQLEVLQDLPKTRKTSSIASVNSKSKNLLPFLSDLLMVTCKDVPSEDATPKFNTKPTKYGKSENLKPKINKCNTSALFNEVMTEFSPLLIQILKEGIVKALKSCYSCGSDFTIPSIPSDLPTVTIDVGKIDLSNKLMIDPNINNTLLSGQFGSDPSKDLDLFISNAIQSPNTDNVWGGLLNYNFNQASNQITISIPNTTQGGNYGGQPFDTYLKDFMNKIDLFGNGVKTKDADIKGIMNNLIDKLSGNLKSEMTQYGLMSLDKMIDLEKADKVVDKLLECDPCSDETIFDNSFFKFSNEELEEVELKAKNKMNGTIIIDEGCSIEIVSLATGLDTFNAEIPLATTTEQISNVITNLNKSALNIDDNNPTPNDSIKLNTLSLEMLKDLIKVFTSVIFTPKIMSLIQITGKMVEGPSGVYNKSSAYDFTVDFRVFFEFVTRESFAALLKIVFDKIKGEIITLITDVAKQIIQEKIELRFKAIASVLFTITEGLLNSIEIPSTSEFT